MQVVWCEMKVLCAKNSHDNGLKGEGAIIILSACNNFSFSPLTFFFIPATVYFQNLRLIPLPILFLITISYCKPSSTYDDTDAYMFGYGVFTNEYNTKQNFGQKEHRNEDEVMGEW